MSDFKTTPANETPRTRTAHDFGVTDSKGRAIGATIAFYEVDHVEVAADAKSYSRTAPGHYFAAFFYATRAGEHFGATQSPRYFNTAAERDAAVVKYLKDAAKRAQKAAGVQA